MSNQSIIEHRANMYYVEFREEYLALALACTYKKPTGKSKASPYCKALILAIAEGWTNNKRGCKDLTFYMTYEQWGESMYGMFSRPVIIDSVSELVGEKLLSREIFRVGGKDTFRYLFNHTEVNARLKSLEAKEPNVTRQLIDAETGKKVDPSINLPLTSKLIYPDPSINLPNIESTQHLSTEHKETYDADASRTLADYSLEEIAAYLAAHTNQPELSTPIVDKSPEQVATSNPIASDTPEAPTQNENGSQEQPAPGKKPRRPARTLDDTTKARVERVFSYFDKLKQEMTGDPEAKYVRTKTAIGEIKDTLLPCAPTEQRLRKVYMALWNTPRDARSGFEWKKNMTIKAVCGQYEARVIDIIAEEKREAEKKRDQERYMSPTAPIAPVEDDLPFDIERVRANRRRIGNRQVV